MLRSTEICGKHSKEVKGGDSSYGIVTRFHLEALPAYNQLLRQEL